MTRWYPVDHVELLPNKLSVPHVLFVEVSW